MDELGSCEILFTLCNFYERRFAGDDKWYEQNQPLNSSNAIAAEGYVGYFYLQPIAHSCADKSRLFIGAFYTLNTQAKALNLSVILFEVLAQNVASKVAVEFTPRGVDVIGTILRIGILEQE